MTKRRIFLYSVLVLFSVIIGIGAGYFIATFFDLPQIEKLEGYQPSVISRVYSEDGEVIAEFFRERREIVPLSRIPQHLQNAFIAIEDHRFYQHPGIDVRRIFKAAWIDITTWSTVGGGASTITQQLARNLFLT
ncbi:penicillin-binding protein, partial [Candidatus Aerophobetes bacterium]